jgi:hypothetical protein
MSKWLVSYLWERENKRRGLGMGCLQNVGQARERTGDVQMASM